MPRGENRREEEQKVTSEHDNDLLDSALALCTCGIPVFPLPSRSKMPTIKWREEASADPDGARAWWGGEGAGCNIGAVMGGDARVFAIDVDCHDADGLATLSEWEAAHGGLPETVSAETGSGGEHLFYRAQVDRPVRNGANGTAGIDVRGEGGFVLASPSIHPNGRPYTWMTPPIEHEIADADERVYEFLAEFCPRAIGMTAGAAPRFELPEGDVREGGRNATMFAYASSMRAREVGFFDAWAALKTYNAGHCKPPLREGELRKTFEQAYAYAAGRSEEYCEANVIERGEDGEAVDWTLGTTEVVHGLELLAKPRNGAENAMRVVRGDGGLAGRIYYDIRAYTRMVVLPLPWDHGEGERPITDADYAALTAYAERRYLVNAKERLIDAVKSVALEHPRNRIGEWLDSLKWDGTERIDWLLPTYLGAESSGYNAAVLRTLIRGAIWRAKEPGCKYDYLVVLVGDQGLGKSQFIRNMAHEDGWFNDNFASVTGDTAVEKLRGLWFAEFAELLATKSTKDVEAVKAFITQRSDIIRPKYARETEHRPRGCVFVGSTNDLSFLTDKTGNRRFLPVETGVHEAVGDVFDEEACGPVFEQAWAEAMEEFRGARGTWPKPVLPEKYAAEALAMQEKYLEDDPLTGWVQGQLEERLAMASPGKTVRVCAIELADELPDSLKDLDTPRKRQNAIRDVIARTDGWHDAGKQRCGSYKVQRCFERTKEEKARRP